MTALLQSGHAIALEITTRLQGCRVASGAETDLGARVYRGRRAVDDTLVPCATIIEGTDDVQESDGRRLLEARVAQDFEILVYVPCDPTHPNDAAHAAIRDVKRALFRTGGQPDRTLGGKVRRLIYRGRDIGPRADGASLVVAQVTVAVEYVEDVANP